MKVNKISWGCVIIGVISILLSFIGIFFSLEGFRGFNLPFQFLLLMNSFNKNNFLIKFNEFRYFDYFFSIILVISGIGTIWLKPWGRSLAYIYAITVILLSLILMPIHYIAYIINELIRITRESSFMDWVIWGAVLSYILILIGVLLYPITLLFFYSRPKIKERFDSR